MRLRSKRARIIHIIISTILWLAFIPVFFSWHKEIPKSNVLKETGIILIDRSASMESRDVIDEIIEKCSSDFELITCGFSNGLTNPYGPNEENKETNLTKSFSDCLPLIDEHLPEWVWVISDGGFEKEVHIPQTYDSLKKYITHIKPKQKTSDYGLQDFKTDPVWYTRTETELSVSVYRNFDQKDSAINVLLLIDGVISKTKKVNFIKGQKSTILNLTTKALHLGPSFIEIKIAEGQGGSLLQNDHLVKKIQVLRDKLRILRVVGRPTWSSKFLRTYLMGREDIDLIDFHILRSIHDRVLAATKDLALIPFPVEELFVQNIESFDLIIWQNFDNQSYPFFKQQYLQNIKKYVFNGGAVLFWSGKLKWDFTKGPFTEIIPISNKGAHYIAKKAHISNSINQSLLPNNLLKKISTLPELEFNVFPGKLQKNSTSILEIDETPLLAVRKCRKGRVLQINSDSLWDLNFAQNHSDIYNQIIKTSIMWLQKHPDLNLNSYSMNNEHYVKSSTAVEFENNLKQSKTLSFSKDGKIIEQHELKNGFKKFNIKLPSIPGVYQLNIGEQEKRLIALKYIENEFKENKVSRENIESLIKLNFKELIHNQDFPVKVVHRQQSNSLKTNEPYHVTWLYLASVCLLIFGHWVIVSRSPIHYK